MRSFSNGNGGSYANGQGTTGSSQEVPYSWKGGYQGLDMRVDCYALVHGGGYQ